MIAQLDTRYIRTRPKKAFVRLLSYMFFEGRPLTTRGRWINPMVFANLKRIAGKEQKTLAPAPIFIIGTGRSGTTVLGRVLSMHHDIGFLNEPKALWHTAISNEDIVGNYTHRPGRYCLSQSDATPQVMERAQRLYSGFCKMTGSRRVLDKYPEMVFRTPFLRHIFPDARFLFLVRDPHATAGSISAWSQRHSQFGEGSSTDWWGIDDRKWNLLVDEVAASDEEFSGITSDLRHLDHGRDRAGLEWLLSMRAGFAAQAQQGDDVMRFRYEDLAANPEDTLTRLFGFCGLQMDETCVSYAGATLRRTPDCPREPFHDLINAPIHRLCAQLGYDVMPG